MFEKILIANRGEIACRIMRTARRMGVRTVAVYSDADQDALHVSLADEAYHIGEAEALQSYLDMNKILDVAKKSGAQAVHPGYGFLSENPDFACLCEQADVTFIGPSVDVIADMGDKHVAKEVMKNAGLPVVPGFNAKGFTPSQVAQKVSEMSLPVIIKPVAGGGGKGMRLVRDVSELEVALTSATREARASFGNDTLLVEKYLESPRHVEVQIFGDNHGNCVHLFERDCTLQRRHQKVVEEAPAFGLTDEERSRVGRISVEAAKAVGYCGAGTIEFLRDQKGDFYFIEMNTRLQVEHPVTEMITGLDLVEWQLRVASGEELPLAQDDIIMNGHAAEVRLYAEDTKNGFLPSTGKITAMHLPDLINQVRLDAGIQTGGEVSRFYDPMIAKLIVKGADRPDALRKLDAALSQMHIEGVETNVSFLRILSAQSDVQEERIDTNYIERHISELTAPVVPTENDVLWAIVKILADRQPDQSDSIHKQLTYWRLNGDHVEEFALLHPFQDAHVRVCFTDQGYHLQIGDRCAEVKSIMYRNGRLCAIIDGVKQEAFVARTAGSLKISGAKGTVEFFYENPVSASEKTEEHTGSLASPMPGKVIAVSVKQGDKVVQGDPLVTIEAMKMEHTIKASIDGQVESIACQPGDVIEEGVDMLKIVAG